jgi:hypothetical protein
MHYKIAPGVVIKTENAAKPESQGSSYLRKLLSRLTQVNASFDYGCGKLRYCDALLDSTDTLALVDSEVQLSRLQVLRKHRTSIREVMRRSNRVAVYNEREFTALKQTFDRAFCINVLPVIPLYAKRREVVELIRSKLRRRGTCLFVVQYRNSDFDRMRRMPNARAWRDGFLIESLRGPSFYGLISPDRLRSLVLNAGFEVRHMHLNEGSAYLCAVRK